MITTIIKDAMKLCDEVNRLSNCSCNKCELYSDCKKVLEGGKAEFIKECKDYGKLCLNCNLANICTNVGETIIDCNNKYSCGTCHYRNNCADHPYDDDIPSLVGKHDNIANGVQGPIEGTLGVNSKVIKVTACNNNGNPDCIHCDYSAVCICRVSRHIEPIKHEQPVVKPPLGIMPKYIWDEKRLDNLLAAIGRYSAVKKPIPELWVEEYNQLVTGSDKNGKQTN